MTDFSAMFILIVVPIILYYFISFIIGLRVWVNGKVPFLMTFNNENLFEIYVAFSVLIIKADRKNYKEKFEYLTSYIKKKFPDSLTDFLHSYSHALKDKPIRINYAARWLRLHLKKRNRLQLILFMSEIAMQDGRVNPKEKEILLKTCNRLKITEKEYNSIIAGLEEAYRRKLEEEYYKRERTKKAQAKRKPVSSHYQKEQMAKILGVSSNEAFEKIKKAYRKLVKLHHPDRFHNNGPEQIQLAKERFIEIQLAYEYFEKLKN